MSDFPDQAVTLDHVRKALEWAERGGGKADGITREYDQGIVACGTACCVWGMARELAGIAPHITDEHGGRLPSKKWRDQSNQHKDLAGRFTICEAEDALPAIRAALDLPPKEKP